MCSIILTHRNYSDLVEDSLLSLFDQTYQNWECVVVDDFSAEDERQRLSEIVERLHHDRVRLIQNAEQLGQVGAFFAGLAETTGEFVSPLDPDDRLDPNYLEEMVKAHLNETVFCPIVSCEQRLFRTDSGAVVTGTWKGRLRIKSGLQASDQSNFGIDVTAAPDDGPLLYFSPNERHWLWTSTSAMMVRRTALNLLAPNKRLDLGPALDAYLANGAHYLGGTLFLSRPLVYRGIHANAWYLTDNIVSMRQNLAREGWKTQAPQCKRYVVEAMFRNGVTRCFSAAYLGQVLRKHFDKEQMTLIAEACPEAYRLWRPPETPVSSDSLLRRVWKRARRALLGT